MSFIGPVEPLGSRARAASQARFARQSAIHHIAAARLGRQRGTASPADRARALTHAATWRRVLGRWLAELRRAA